MKILQNNLSLQKAAKSKTKAINELRKKGELIQKAKKVQDIVDYLKHNEMFLDGHNNIFAYFGSSNIYSIGLNGKTVKVESLEREYGEVTFVLLNATHVCPIFKGCRTRLIPLQYTSEVVQLSNTPIGGRVYHGKISEYGIKSCFRVWSIEEIDLHTFDAYEYYSVKDNVTV